MARPQQPLSRTIIWRNIASAPKDGKLIEVAWLEGDNKNRTPKRTRWVNGQWDGSLKPTHWRPVDRTLYYTGKSI